RSRLFADSRSGLLARAAHRGRRTQEMSSLTTPQPAPSAVRGARGAVSTAATNRTNGNCSFGARFAPKAELIPPYLRLGLGLGLGLGALRSGAGNTCDYCSLCCGEATARSTR